MSLTAGLQDAESVVPRFFWELFPHLDPILEEWREKVSNAETIRPAERVLCATLR